jgi:hypothetical protein
VKAYAADMKQPVERVGVLVIRIWMEHDSGSSLRARITRTLDISARDDVVTAATTDDEICAEVRAWLRAFSEISPREI